MAMPSFTMRELIEAGVHFGHKTKRWNPRMAPFIYGIRNDVHIIDLQQTVPMLHHALLAVRDVVARNGRVLFVGTKRQAVDVIAESASRCGQYYINQRWLGGMLTNWNTIQSSIKRLKKLEEQLKEGSSTVGFTKKELLQMERQREKLDKSLGGIKNMGGLPDMLVIIDTNKEDLAVKEAIRLNIPIAAIVDTNSSADGITYPIPGNDDAIRAIKLYCQLISDAALDGIQQGLSSSGVDLGASAEIPEGMADKGDDEVSSRPAKGKQQQHNKKAAAVVVKKQPKAKEAAAEDASEDAAPAEAEATEKSSEKKAGKPASKKKAS